MIAQLFISRIVEKLDDAFVQHLTSVGPANDMRRSLEVQGCCARHRAITQRITDNGERRAYVLFVLEENLCLDSAQVCLQIDIVGVQAESLSDLPMLSNRLILHMQQRPRQYAESLRPSQQGDLLQGRGRQSRLPPAILRHHTDIQEIPAHGLGGNNSLVCLLVYRTREICRYLTIQFEC